MNLLLDTQICLWLLSGDIDVETQEQIGEADEVFFSDTSLWEVAASGRSLSAKRMHDALIESGLTRIRPELLDFTTLASLPASGGDHFDRILVAQARNRGMTILTNDEVVASYGSVTHLEGHTVDGSEFLLSSAGSL